MTFQKTKISKREQHIDQLIAELYNQIYTHKTIKATFENKKLKSKIENVRKQLFRSIPPGKDE